MVVLEIGGPKYFNFLPLKMPTAAWGQKSRERNWEPLCLTLTNWSFLIWDFIKLKQ